MTRCAGSGEVFGILHLAAALELLAFPAIPTAPGGVPHLASDDVGDRRHRAECPAPAPRGVHCQRDGIERRYSHDTTQWSSKWKRGTGVMARTTRVVHTCDLHGDETEATTTVLVTSGNKRIELDLCQAHVDALVGAGRRPASPPRASRRRGQNGTGNAATKRPTKARQSGPSTAAVREWANQNGHSVSARGRVPADVVAAYSEAHS